MNSKEGTGAILVSASCSMHSGRQTAFGNHSLLAPAAPTETEGGREKKGNKDYRKRGNDLKEIQRAA